MDAHRVALLAGAVTAAVLVHGAAAAPPPTTGYRWAQPWCASVVTAGAQLPASISTAPPAEPAVPGSDYRWTQPWCAVTTPGAQPPAWIPAG